MKEQRQFNATDIKWIKSVTRDKGKAWSYFDVRIGDTFPLNFSKNPKWYPTNYLKPKRKEIIALFQTMQATEGFKEGWYVTHLVSPIDEIIEKENEGSHPYTRLMTVIAINTNPYHIDEQKWSLYKCNRGQICDIKTIEQRHSQISNNQKQKFIWSLFNDIDTSLFNNIPTIEDERFDIDDYTAQEGRERTILKLHKFRERDPKIIAKAKAKTENRFYCEVCLFNFETQYPNLGSGFIECHHKKPISEGDVRETQVKDLAIVCANCHRMLHNSKDIRGNYLSISELTRID
ncbi:MAG: hypothetical protein GVY19_05760 [Bacteroidetes bacterium]|jgi:hypothetical protein|nr:hypothetical protein [Bacteroidota bacterium]